MKLQLVLFLLYVNLFTAISKPFGHLFENTTIEKNANYQNSIKLQETTRNCSVFPISTNVRHDIQEKLDSGVKLIIMELTFPYHSGPLPGEVESDIFKPFLWERSKGRHGQSMLFLKTGFQILSLFTLSYGTEKLNIEMYEDPNGCLLQRDIREIEYEIRQILLDDFGGISPNGSFIGGSLGEDEHVCNTHLRNVSNRAEFYHVCCHKTDAGDIVCEELEKNLWVQILLYCIFFINFVTVMYCPYLIPVSWYENIDEESNYIFSSTTPVKCTTDESDLSIGNKKEEITSENTKIISKMVLNVDRNNLVPPNDAPVGILRFLHYRVFLCKNSRRKEDASNTENEKFPDPLSYLCNNDEKDLLTEDCCGNSICGQCKKDDSVFKEWTWNSCLKKPMIVIYFFLLMTPLLYRLFVYYEYESPEYIERERAASKRKLDIHYVHFPGNFISILTPIHILFIFSYSVFIFDTLIFGVLKCSKLTFERDLKNELQQCLKDMSKSSFLRSSKKSIGILILPFYKHGIFALFYIAFYWLAVSPLVLIVLIFYNVPTLNICIRLFCHFFVLIIPCEKLRKKLISSNQQSDEKQEKKTHLQDIASFLCLISVISFAFMFIEVTFFYVEMVVYTLIGVILYASKTLIFVSLFFMLAIYAGECFGSVHKKYQTFNQIINKVVLKRVEKEVASVAKQSAETQANTAFYIKRTEGADDERTFKVEKNDKGKTTVHVPGTMLFFTRNDAPFLARSFYFRAIEMEYEGCPGSISKNIFQALRQFSMIVFFLFFVIMVVLAFEYEYSMSGLNQMLATLAGGLIPLVLRHILFKAPKGIRVDPECEIFQSVFSELINTHTDEYIVEEIELKRGDQICQNENLQLICNETDAVENASSNDNEQSPLIQDNNVDALSEINWFYLLGF